MATNWCIAGVGSPHSDDQAGWKMAEILRGGEPDGNIVTVSQPLVLLDCCDGCRGLVIVDACSTGAPAGTISRLQWPDSRIHRQHRFSTHGISVAEVLQLGQQLQRLPEKVILYGVEVGRCSPGGQMSSAVEEALVELEPRIRQEISAGS